MRSTTNHSRQSKMVHAGEQTLALVVADGKGTRLDDMTRSV